MGDLWGEIQECLRLLDLALIEARKRGDAMVRAEAEYYSAKAQVAFALKEEGYPVTLIEMVTKGVPEVAAKMSAYHAAQVEYENAKEARQCYKRKLDVLREEYQREWNQSGMRN